LLGGAPFSGYLSQSGAVGSDGGLSQSRDNPSKHSKAPGKLGTKFVLASGLMSPSEYRWLGPLRETLTDEATNHGKLLCHSKRDGPVGPL